MDRESLNFNRRSFGALMLSSALPARAAEAGSLVFSCSEDNDVYRALGGEAGKFRRFVTPAETLEHAKPGSGVLLLSGDDPERRLVVPEDYAAHAASKRLRVYVEFPAPVSETPRPTATAQWERAVVSSGFFGGTLPLRRILSLHNCRYVPLPSLPPGARPHLILGRVAGFDSAIYGIPDKGAHPLLFEDEAGRILTATAALSRFVAARYAPAGAWLAVWRAILDWLSGGLAGAGFRASPVVMPSYAATARLPGNAEQRAATRGVQWYENARLFIHPSWEKLVDQASQYTDQVGPAPPRSLPGGDGSLGMLEGHDARILPDGSQNLRWWIRADCVGETAMVFALAQKITGKSAHRRVAANLIDYLLLRSRMAAGSRMDPRAPSYGLIGWNNTPKYHHGEDGFDVYYGDDNARCLLGLLTTMAVTGESRWIERFWLAVLGNFRLIGRQGHQKSRYDQAPLEANGWRHYFEADTVLHDMNYEAYPWALFLWASKTTGWPPFLERIERGIRLTMDAYPLKWRWSNSITSQQARILLPLAWLVRVSDTPEHRTWLRRVAMDLLAHQHASGAIAEWTGLRETGLQMPPASNEQYGTGEGTLIQTNGDPATDLLYTMNFAFIGLHEAYGATGEQYYKDAEDRIAGFLVRAQASSRTRPEFDGAWFRAFDFGKWDYWASSSDSGWGAWCTESGWSQSWIASTFCLRILHQSLWDVVSAVGPFSGFDIMRASMFPA